MRPIKFRAWTHEMEMTDDFYVNHLGQASPWDPTNGQLVDHPEWVLMQFTGLLDKNGKEIYEGDVVSHPDHLHPVTIRFSPLTGYMGGFFEGTNPKYLEVIGNIYSNPDLLESKE